MSEFKELKEKLCYKKQNGFMTDFDMAVVNDFCDGYMNFLSKGKTERLCVKEAVELAKKAGFTEFSADKKYSAGDKVYVNNHEKSLVFAVIGTEPVENGTRITAAHIDSPRLDLKPNPL